MKIIQVINCEPRKDAVLFKHKNTYYLDTLDSFKSYAHKRVRIYEMSDGSTAGMYNFSSTHMFKWGDAGRYEHLYRIGDELDLMEIVPKLDGMLRQE